MRSELGKTNGYHVNHGLSQDERAASMPQRQYLGTVLTAFGITGEK